MIETDELQGGCLCGAVRYVVRGPVVETSLCHCVDCRRASGAPYIAWSFFPSGALAWTHGQPKLLIFAGRERRFCGDCGTPLHFYDPNIPECFEISTCSLDEPQAHIPANECWTMDRIAWATLSRRLPDFHQSAPLPENL